MKRFRMITLMMLVCSVAAYSQIWISFGWNDSHCRDCEWMERSLRMTDRQARDYHNIVHKYGQKIEKEARKDYKHWDKAYRNIYSLRMDRDHKIQRILSPEQFGLYIRFTREEPVRIHDYRGWYENPRYYGYQIHTDWRRYEDRYWSFRWDGRDYHNYRWDAPGHYNKPAPPRNNPHYDNRPPANAPHNYGKAPANPPRNNNNDRLRSEPQRNQPAPGNNKSTPSHSKDNKNSKDNQHKNSKPGNGNGKSNDSGNSNSQGNDNKSSAPRTSRR